MDVALKGNSPVALTAGILLLSRARSFGIPQPQVSILGDPTDITPVLGPAILHSHVLASCGVGREVGKGALVVITGPPDAPLLVSLAQEGLGSWFAVDSGGQGLHPGTRALMRMSRDPRPAARELGKDFRRLLARLGVPAEPALLDLLFGAPTPPLTRIALTLRAGREMTGEGGGAVTSFLSPVYGELPDPLQPDLPGEETLARFRDGRLDGILGRLRPDHRDAAEDWLRGIGALADEDGGRDLDLLAAVAEVLSHLAVLPPHSMLPPPDAAADAVATGLVRALGAAGGTQNATASLVEIFRFLGGRFTDSAAHPIQLPSSLPPPDRLGRWKWFAAGAAEARGQADVLWRRVMDFTS
ncbi:MAG: hypothetical protein H6739_24265 [Alphaproteobacteria bacterium]|nr:hypothetical protein [Alphaproteobacteria bacterium]